MSSQVHWYFDVISPFAYLAWPRVRALAQSRPVELRPIVYTTNTIESLNARFRKTVRHRGHFLTEQSALKVLYLVATERHPNRSNPTGQLSGWKTNPQRPDHPLRRPHRGRRLTMTITTTHTVRRTVPTCSVSEDRRYTTCVLTNSCSVHTCQR